MKYYILIITIICSFVGNTQNDSIRGNQYYLVGKMAREAIFPPGCGTQAWAMNTEFQILNFSDKDYKEKTIDVYIPCPEFYDKAFFNTDKIYTILLSDEKQVEFSFAISPIRTDESERKKIIKLWAIEITPIE